MNIEFHRLPGGYCSQAVRDDGVTVFVPGYDRKHAVPHDLAHYAAEHGFGEARGFWGSVAAGAMFGGMKVISGRRPPHAAELSRRVIRANAEQIGTAEALAAVAFDAVNDGIAPGEAARKLAHYWTVTHTGPCPYDSAGMARSCELLADLARRWRAVANGAALTVAWDLPVQRPAGPRRSRGRSVRAHR